MTSEHPTSRIVCSCGWTGPDWAAAKRHVTTDDGPHDAIVTTAPVVTDEMIERGAREVARRLYGADYDGADSSGRTTYRVAAEAVLRAALEAPEPHRCPDWSGDPDVGEHSCAICQTPEAPDA